MSSFTRRSAAFVGVGSLCTSHLSRGIAVLGIALLGACSAPGSAPTAPAGAKKEVAPQATVPVDKLVSKPESYQGPVAVSGKVIEADSGGGGFALGCEDACVRVPVRFKGKAPEAQTDVVVRGRLAKNPDGLYFLEAESVERP